MGFDLELDDDQLAIAQLFAGFLEKESPSERVRAAEPLGFDGVLWSALCDLGAAGMSSPTEDGVRNSDLVVACEQLGRYVAPVPWIEHLSAAPLLDDPAAGAGDPIATLALHPARGEGTWRLVPAGAVASTVVGLDGNDLVAVTAEPPGQAPANLGAAPIADRSARVGERRVVGDRVVFEQALDRWRLLTAAALVGIAGRARDLALDYLAERRQFGRPIGSYQALQHAVADFPAHHDGARMLVHKAAWAADGDLHGQADVADGDLRDATVLVRMAFCFAAEAAAMITDRSLHCHGSYGFSLEYDIQLFYRRARAWPLLLGDPAGERAKLASLLWPAGEG